MCLAGNLDVAAANEIHMLNGGVLKRYVIRTGVCVKGVEVAVLKIHISDVVSTEKTSVNGVRLRR